MGGYYRAGQFFGGPDRLVAGGVRLRARKAFLLATVSERALATGLLWHGVEAVRCR